ncbi:MAG: hypothetical protein CBC33_006905 [Coraliomargarita sp. TMED73]|nr:MAG: hypothetical protein CBC33_006905 [Coraliomargarita sp. TMED73]
MSATVYHILHIVGILLVFMGYGALIARALSGSDHAGVKKLGSITSGIGLLLLFIAGCALISKMDYSFASGWIIAKLIIWIALGGLIALINRKPQLAGKLWWILAALGALAVYLVYVQPF